jgi:hypothetical protein
MDQSAARSYAGAEYIGMTTSGARATPDVLVIEDLTVGFTPTDLANQLVGTGVTVTNVTYTGTLVSGGRFSGGADIVGFNDGIILSSGYISDVVGPNLDDGITRAFGTPGDADLATLSGFTTFDAAVLEFDFIPTEAGISFDYVFASDEYNEFVNTNFNDVFAFFVNGVNCAVVGPNPVTINTINNGNPEPGEDPTPTNPQLYINNDPSDGGGTIDTEMDGLTKILTCNAIVNPGVLNHLKIAIADASDFQLDSAVFLKSGSFTSFLPPRAYMPIIVKGN